MHRLIPATANPSSRTSWVWKSCATSLTKMESPIRLAADRNTSRISLPGMSRNPDWGKTVAIVQSNYIPWIGYFNLIALADVFVLLDDVQYTRRDWRNRNQ